MHFHLAASINAETGIIFNMYYIIREIVYRNLPIFIYISIVFFFVIKILIIVSG